MKEIKNKNNAIRKIDLNFIFAILPSLIYACDF